jgi:chloride channel 3/4/5
MDLVYECFVKLGLRYICVLKDGKFAGMVSSNPWSWPDGIFSPANHNLQTHKKTFVKYIRELEEKETGH